MKKILTIILVSLSLISWGQNREAFVRKVDSITQLQQQNRFYLDTLWVMDSSQKYSYYNYPNTPELIRKYKVISRNNMGNVLISSDFPVGGYMQPDDNSWIDTITYFDGSNIMEHCRNIWNSSTGNWQEYEFVEYDLSGLIKETYKKDYSNEWQEYNYSRRYFYENSNGRTIAKTMSTYIPDSDIWEPKNKKEYHYDEYGNDTLQIIKAWKNKDWKDSILNRKSYSQGLLFSETQLRIDTTDNIWINYWKILHSYNEEKLVDTAWYKSWNKFNSIWVDYSISYITYDNLNRRKELTQISYHHVTQQLENYSKRLYGYENSNDIITWQVWKMPEGYWENHSRDTHSYIEENTYDTIQLDIWLPYEQRWYINNLTINEYDHRMNLVSRKNHGYDYNYELYFQDSTCYFWSPFGASSVNETITYNLSVYPNPASKMVKFEIENQITIDNSPLHIYNIAGQKIDELLLSDANVTWDCSGVKPGVYLYSIINDGKKFSGKIVVK
jgi:type IX secretion system substrate protein